MNLYISATGDDANPGTLDRPLATLDAAHSLVPAGEGGRISLRGGIYPWSGKNWTKGGNAGNDLVVIAHENEPVILDNTPRKLDPSAGQFSLYGSHLTFCNIIFQNGYMIHQQGTPVGQNFIGCTIRRMANQGISGGGVLCHYIGNWFDDCGGIGSDPSQGIYISGSYCTVAENLFTRLRGQYAMQLYPTGLNASVVRDNVLVNNAGGIVFTGSGTVIDRNVLIESGAIAPITEAHDFRVTNNYIERQHAGEGIVFVSPNLTPGNFTGGFTIKGNTINNAHHEPNGRSFSLSGKIDAAASVIDGNRYLGPAFVARTEKFNPYQAVDYQSLAAWQAAIQAVNPQWEANGRYLPVESPAVASLATLCDGRTAEQIKSVVRDACNAVGWTFGPRVLREGNEYQ